MQIFRQLFLHKLLIINMVTKQDVKEVRNFLNKFNKKISVCMSDDVLKAIDNMCADYEFKYKM